MSKTLEQIEEELRSVTDQVGRLMDRVLQKGFVPVFRCSHSGLFFPGNYVKDWGRGFGIGLGPNPVSECLDSDYYAPLPAITPETRDLETIMHPMEVTRAQVDLTLVAPEEYEAARLVLDSDDPGMRKRARILRAKQMENPRSRLRTLLAAHKEVR